MVKKFKLQILIALTVVLLLLPALNVLASGQFRTGNTYIVSNTTNPGWGDPVSANSGDIVQFKVDIANLGSETAKNVHVRTDLPNGVTGNTLSSTIHVTAENASEMSDTATVNVSASGTKSLTYFPGHAVLVTNAGSTTLPETITSSGVNIGDVLAGESNYVEVTFKATVAVVQEVTPTPTLTGLPTATPTPTGTLTPTPTGTLTPTPTVLPTGAQENVIQCPEGFVSTISGSNIICIQTVNNNTNTSSSSSSSNSSTGEVNVSTGEVNVNVTSQGGQVTTQAVVPSGVTGVTQLPKTGLPLLAWAFSGLVPLGAGLKKFGGKSTQDNSSSARSIWQKREWEKE